jgi:hypothetical protein
MENGRVQDEATDTERVQDGETDMTSVVEEREETQVPEPTQYLPVARDEAAQRFLQP